MSEGALLAGVNGAEGAAGVKGAEGAAGVKGAEGAAGVVKSLDSAL